MVLEPLGGHLSGMLWVIVLLKNDTLYFYAIISHALFKFPLQNPDLESLKHLPINCACVSRLFPQCTAPYNDWSTVKFKGSCNLLRNKALILTQCPPSEPIQLSLVTSCQTNLFQPSRVQYWWAIAKSSPPSYASWQALAISSSPLPSTLHL